jgi:hypothetical protein
MADRERWAVGRVTLYRFTVSYEGEIEAPDPDAARTWAKEGVEAGRRSVVTVEVEPVKRKDAEAK